jgi:hypothetical protein
LGEDEGVSQDRWQGVMELGATMIMTSDTAVTKVEWLADRLEQTNQMH